MTQALPKVIIHGGAGSSVGHKERLLTLREDFDLDSRKWTGNLSGLQAL
jgi:hypothetical protein